MIGIAIISHDTKNIYEPGRQAYSDASCLSFYHVAQRRWRRADCNCTDALYMVGLRVRWLVARLRQASPVNMPYSLAGLSESNKHTAQDQQTCCCEKGIYNICNEGMPHQISKSLSRDSIFIWPKPQFSLDLFSIGSLWCDMVLISNFRKFLWQSILSRRYFGHFSNNESTKPVAVSWRCSRPSDLRYPGLVQFTEDAVTAVARKLDKEEAIIRYVGKLPLFRKRARLSPWGRSVEWAGSNWLKFNPGKSHTGQQESMENASSIQITSQRISSPVSNSLMLE